MATLRDLFHEIANWHNKITIASGCTREILKDRPLNKLTKEELKAEHAKLVGILDKIEADAVTANKKVIQLKEFIYKKINPDLPVV